MSVAAIPLIMACCYYGDVPKLESAAVSRRPPTLIALPSYLAGNVAHLGNRSLVAMLKEHGLGLAQYAVLVALLDFGALPPHELASRLQTDRSHISAYVEMLVKRDWVNRVQDTADRRRVSVDLTTEGREFIRGLVSWAAAAQEDFLSALTETEQRTLRALLLKILASGDSLEASDDETV